MNFIDLIGYAASGIVLISFLMRDIKWLRIVNTLGCAGFISYGMLLSPISWPIIITNAAIVAINVFYLSRPKKSV